MIPIMMSSQPHYYGLFEGHKGLMVNVVLKQASAATRSDLPQRPQSTVPLTLASVHCPSSERSWESCTVEMKSCSNFEA